MKTNKAKLATAKHNEVFKVYKVILETPNSYEVRPLALRCSTVKVIKKRVTTTMEFKARMKNALYLKALEMGMSDVLQVVAYFKGGKRDE